jgi:hypothetical protein
VVFLHASMEDLLRSVLAWKLRSAKQEHLEEVPSVGETIAFSATPASPARLPRSPVGGMLVQDSR